ncbi:DUF3224 domain-containing protein [Kitasatospora sp. A2-31]|uniref:DUF3224 domain-containing protein n=1 Tax=Kitasatospora sp. A2-31 TaxID=2916414 RepID=UPI001EEA1D72|nr:DUF3224 domain-containing protein [Kitasatospora sp. A2-31]MCG6495319.1 DUF3224 domain-containing protein [Kitasatospora sp. A2-31]
MGTRSSGAFEVTAFEPEETDEEPGATLGRVRITKEFTGGLTGRSTVRMLSVLDGSGGPAAYVAVERFTGELDGRKGSFVLQHAAPGSSGERLAIRVVSGTGAGELAGITGTFELAVDDEGRHTYTLEYELG